MRRLAAIFGFFAALAVGLPARADDSPAPTPFDRGRFGLSIQLGEETNFDVQYIVVGAGISYFVLDGLALGLSAAHDFGDGPSITTVSPSLEYVAQPLVGKWPAVPYVGAFYNHWFIGGDYGDVDAIGGRAGVMYVSRTSLLLGLGAAYEHVLGACTSGCDSVYPDVTIGFGF